MNRRDFLRSILAAGAALPVLPAVVSTPSGHAKYCRGLPLEKSLKCLEWVGCTNQYAWKGFPPNSLSIVRLNATKLDDDYFKCELVIDIIPKDRLFAKPFDFSLIS